MYYLSPSLSLFKKPLIMNNLLYYIAVLLLIGWAIGVIGYSLGGLIHILAIIAFLAILLRLIRGGKNL